ncbi:hypothetical protein MES5069_1380005 [Mesorhizobium escarrei]|uniref:Uncharacterized protein n=1 Tax=Mesorhizobium escarrei TaxID=666018 RepID=A0ABN8JFR6_9HYPH|nr:hypothetical protein MES5069_1380005 [Mesorhizobium escarrei]
MPANSKAGASICPAPLPCRASPLKGTLVGEISRFNAPLAPATVEIIVKAEVMADLPLRGDARQGGGGAVPPALLAAAGRAALSDRSASTG